MKKYTSKFGDTVYPMLHTAIDTENQYRGCGQAILVAKHDVPIKLVYDHDDSTIENNYFEGADIFYGAVSCWEFIVAGQIASQCIPWKSTNMHISYDYHDFLQDFQEKLRRKRLSKDTTIYIRRSDNRLSTEFRGDTIHTVYHPIIEWYEDPQQTDEEERNILEALTVKQVIDEMEIWNRETK